MYFHHSDAVWDRFPQLMALVLVVRQVRHARLGEGALDDIFARVAASAATRPESEMASIQAWRQAYADMGLKPTQYRCAAEALLRRFRKDGRLPAFHPLIDMLNAESLLAAIPIAALDCAHIAGGITVGPADGRESHENFQGEIEHPAAGEIIFCDEAHQAHSRRWVFRQGAQSVVHAGSDTVLIVAEALHGQALEELQALRERLVARAIELGITIARQDMLTTRHRHFEFAGDT